MTTERGTSAEELAALAGYGQPEPLYTRLSDVKVERVHWLWPGRIPYAKVSIIEGDPDRAKSTVTMDLAARVSTGTPMPGEPVDRGTPHGVVLVIAEDDLADTVVPRLNAHGGDLARIGSVNLRRDEEGNVIPLTLPEDLDRIRKVVRQTDAGLVIIDPITAYLSETINSNSDASVRRAMTPLAQLAQELGVAIVLVRHLNKSGELKAKYRGGGSIAFTGSARSVLVVEEHPDQPGLMVLARVKGNLARAVPSFGYRVESAPAHESPLIVWTGVVDIDADTLLRGRDGRLDAPQRDEAAEVLRSILGDGPLPVAEVQRQAAEAGIASRTLERAKKNLGVRAARDRDEITGQTRQWVWHLPAQDEDDDAA